MVGLSYPPAVIEALKVMPIKLFNSVSGTLKKKTAVKFVLRK